MTDMPDWVRVTPDELTFLNVQSPDPWKDVPGYLARGPFVIVSSSDALPAKQLPAAGLRAMDFDGRQQITYTGLDENNHTIELRGRLTSDGQTIRGTSPSVGRFTIRPLTLNDKKLFGPGAGTARSVQELADMYFDPQPWQPSDLDMFDDEEKQ